MKKLSLDKDHPLAKYYEEVFNECIGGKIETYNSINMKGRTYEFKYHFRNLLDEKMKVACKYCWSYNHQTNSHQGNVHRYDHPDKVYTHLPVIDDQYWCPYGCESYENNRDGQKQFFKHFIAKHTEENEEE